MLHIDPSAQSRTMTESELRTIVDVSHEDGVIESEEKEMIYNVFDLGDAKAKDVMVPRVHVTFADINSTYDELINIFREDKFTRLPIYEDTTDNVVGTINMKDLLLYDNTKEFHIRDILRDAYFTYEYKNISELLVEMREAKFNIAIVLDEYGETAGLLHWKIFWRRSSGKSTMSMMRMKKMTSESLALMSISWKVPPIWTI